MTDHCDEDGTLPPEWPAPSRRWPARTARLAIGKDSPLFSPHRFSVASVETTHSLPLYNDDTLSRSRGLGLICHRDAPPGYEHNVEPDSVVPSDKAILEHKVHHISQPNNHIRYNVSPGSTIRYSIDVSCTPEPVASCSSSVTCPPLDDVSEELDRLITLSNDLLDLSNAALDSSIATRLNFSKFTHNVDAHLDRSVRRSERSVRQKMDLVDERLLWSERLERDLTDGPAPPTSTWKQYHQDSLEVGRQVMAIERAALLSRTTRDLGESVATLRPKKHSAPVRSASRAVPRYDTLHVNIDALPGASSPLTTSSTRPHLISLFQTNDPSVSSCSTTTTSTTSTHRPHTRTASDLLAALVSANATSNRQKHRPSITSDSAATSAPESASTSDEDFVDVFGEIKSPSMTDAAKDNTTHLTSSITWSPSGSIALVNDSESALSSQDEPLVKHAAQETNPSSPSPSLPPSKSTSSKPPISIPSSPSKLSSDRPKLHKPRSSVAHIEARLSHHRTLSREVGDLVKEDPSLRRHAGLSEGDKSVSAATALLKTLFSNPTSK